MEKVQTSEPIPVKRNPTPQSKLMDNLLCQLSEKNGRSKGLLYKHLGDQFI